MKRLLDLQPGIQAAPAILRWYCRPARPCTRSPALGHGGLPRRPVVAFLHQGVLAVPPRGPRDTEPPEAYYGCETIRHDEVLDRFYRGVHYWTPQSGSKSSAPFLVRFFCLEPSLAFIP